MPTILRPSSADIWTYCAAQPLLVETFPPDDTPSDEAMEGTCAAWLAEMVLTGQAETCRDMVGQLCPENNWPVDHAMANYIQGYCDMVTGRGGVMEAERRVYLNEFINGTPDAYAVVSTEDPVKLAFGEPTDLTLNVDDLKYGFGIVTPHSRQVVIYAGALFNELTERGVAITKVRIGIYQPRAMHHDGIYRTRTITPQQLIAEIEHIIERGKMCFEPDPVATPGRHCKYCPVAHNCPASTTEMYDIFAVARASSARKMSPQEVSNQLAFIELAEDVLKGLKRATHAEANARMDAGERFPGWGRERGWGNRKFRVEPDMVKLFTGIDPLSGKPCTPAELERRGADPDILKLITVTPQTKAKLTPISTEDIAKKFGE